MPRCRAGAHGKLLASGRCSGGGALAEGARDLSGRAISRRTKARRQWGWRMSSVVCRLSSANLVRTNGVVLLRVAGSGQRAAQNGRGDERYELSHGGATSEWSESCRPTDAQVELMADAPEPRRTLAAELGIGSGAMEELVAGEAGNGKRRNATKVFSSD